jgi:hypothetical protein
VIDERGRGDGLNLTIADILMHKSETRWHDDADTLRPGPHTLVAYFHPHAM